MTDYRLIGGHRDGEAVSLPGYVGSHTFSDGDIYEMNQNGTAEFVGTVQKMTFHVPGHPDLDVPFGRADDEPDADV